MFMSLKNELIQVLINAMSTVEEIEKAIGDLPRDAFWKLTDKLIERREAAWDAQLELDVAAGSLDALWAQAEQEI